MEFSSFKTDSGILCKVPLGRTDMEAIIDPESLAFLVKLGLSSNWQCTPKGYVVASARGGQKVSVARVLMDAGEGEHVRYRDRNPLNISKSNLEVVPSKMGTKRDRDLLSKATQ